MGEEEGWGWPPSPSGSPMYISKDDHWTHFDNSVTALSFGFFATAILISMFLVMAIFERFLRPNSPALSPSSGRNPDDIESQMSFNGKFGYQATKVSTKARDVSVLMPGEDVPTFLANPAPLPCPPERDPCPLHQQNSLPIFLNSDSNAQS